VYAQWGQFRAWAEDLGRVDDALVEIDPDRVGAPAPCPGQVFAIGLNYRAHAEEAGLDLPEIPVVFTKFPSAITGPRDRITLPKGSVDFEVELVAVVGREAHRVSSTQAWEHIAGLTVGQDLSERELQLAGPPPQQYNMGKSYSGFAPIGPALVTPDEFDDPDDIAISCSLSGVEVQKTRTSDMIFSIPQIVEFLSSVTTLWPGDAIFTGTPSGVGWTRDPKLLIGPDDELVTRAEGIGEMRHTFRAS
jgi:2-keto-4-pentenoate hydratase/2-oxohepta-3-ene-1,7-dioic acid hydratase in catechol pathway